LGQTTTFGAPFGHVWNAPMNRHSGPNVGNALVSGPETLSRRASAMCHEVTFGAGWTAINQGALEPYPEPNTNASDP
jgi:hypothetical protein